MGESKHPRAEGLLWFHDTHGLVSLPAMDDYWHRHPLLHYSPIADRISRDRFRDIHRFLHFADNSVLLTRDNPSYDHLGKVRPILERLQERFTNMYQPHCENAIDEAMIPFQGRSSLKQYMPAKPVKRGIKVWCRVDLHNGNMCEVQVYTGRSERAEGGLGRRVVLDLSQGKHHHLYFDNFFSSVSLLDTLLQKGVYACGTARQNYRDFPDALKMKGKGKIEMERHGLKMRYMYKHSLGPRPSPLHFNCVWADCFLPTQLKMHTLNMQRGRPGTEAIHTCSTLANT